MSRVDGERVFLRPLAVADVSDAYVAWMNDPETGRFLETRWRRHDRADVEAFVAEKAASPVEHLYGVFLRQGGGHIGNLKIGPVDPHHAVAPLSYFLGEPSARGRGLATEAVRLGVELAFRSHGVAKLVAGAYDQNLASLRVLEKAGFRREGLRRGYFAFEGGRADLVEFGLLAEEVSGPG